MYHTERASTIDSVRFEFKQTYVVLSNITSVNYNLQKGTHLSVLCSQFQRSCINLLFLITIYIILFIHLLSGLEHCMDFIDIVPELEDIDELSQVISPVSSNQI